MATLYHFPSSLSISSRKLFLAPQQQQQQQHYLIWDPHEHLPRKHFTICACSTKKSRGGRSRKVKSNAELCNDIREFLTAVGFPEDHVPSTRELSQHGRIDLANIVRRRGYKLVRELLANSLKSDIDGLDSKKSLNANQDAISDHEDLLTGQDEKVNNVVEDISSSSEVSITGNDAASLSSDSDLYSDDSRCLHVESSANLFLEETASFVLTGQNDKVNNITEGISLSTEVSTVEISTGINPYLNSDEHSCMPIEFSAHSSLEEKASSNLKGQDEKVNTMVEDMPFSTEVPIMENCAGSSNPDLNPNDDEGMPAESAANLSLEERASYDLNDQDERVNNIDPAINSDDQSCMPVEVSVNSSFQEKVVKFIQNGDLDIIEGNVYGILNESVPEESEGFIQQQHSENESTLTSKDVPPAAAATHPFRDVHSSSEEITAHLDTETSKREKQSEISRLKFMLHQKELELSWMKEQIEKEKLFLSHLQMKAETEISKAQKLISDKDAELHAVEEGLSGLEEVEIQYCGDGEIVEVSGSFNGWHHRIAMDPQPSSSIIDPIGSRKSRLWSTVLWLYPGTYEIKFIVDGHWSIDPLRESVTRGTICNNILRVDR